MRDLSSVVFRGEPDGVLREQGSFMRPYFFAEHYGQAKAYARGTVPIACVLVGTRVLDLTSPNPLDLAHSELAERMVARFPEWRCRYSGEPRDIWSFLDAADLYDYEGNGQGERWNALFQVAIDEMGYDAIRVMDCTNGTDHQPSAVWVTFSRGNIRFATDGELLAERIQNSSPAEILSHIERTDPGLPERLRRIRLSDDDFQIDRLGHFTALGEDEAHITSVFRAGPAGAEIRPGDWIALDRSYAQSHQNEDHRPQLLEAVLVHHKDIHWAGTDENEFFYLPQSWRLTATSDLEYLKALGPERVRMLVDGESARITRFAGQIERIASHVLQHFDEDACGVFHGPAHWDRVSMHARSVARSLGIDPLVPHIFGLVHDSQRIDEGLDPEHGERAAQFVRLHRDGLFAFLNDSEIDQLARACDLHSHGATEGSAIERACWDGDRLDLWRVGIEPSPEFLCTPYAQREDVIRNAHSVYINDFQDSMRTDYLRHTSSAET